MPSKCLFAEHANYTSMFFPNHAAPSSSATGHQQQHENELEGLNSKETPKPSTNAPRQNGIILGFILKCKSGIFINLDIFLINSDKMNHRFGQMNNLHQFKT